MFLLWTLLRIDEQQNAGEGDQNAVADEERLLRATQR